MQNPLFPAENRNRRLSTMSDKFRKTHRCYLIDHHSPQPPAVPLDQLDPAEYEAFVRESGVDSQMVYCKDHWGVTYYPSKVPGAQAHRGLRGDWLAKAAGILRRCDVEFVAYYAVEYDEGAARRFPEWRVQRADGSPLIREDQYARWGLCCTRTGYRRYCLDQLAEIVSGYRPDALFLDIFGASLCYCDSCRAAFLRRFGYPLPEGEEALARHRTDVLAFLDDGAAAFLDEVRSEMSVIDPTLAITINFSCHYPALVREKLDYQFSEPLLGDNWFSAAYARDTAEGQYPILAPGEASEVYNYSPVDKYRFDLHAIAAQGCRVGMYSGSQHIDGTLEHEEARRLGTVYRELAAMRPHLESRTPLEGIGILQSDASARACGGGVVADAILRAKAHNPHLRAILGAMRLCENAKAPWRVLPEHRLTPGALAGYPLLILPEVFVVSDALAALLERYVHQGGTLLLSAAVGTRHADGAARGAFALETLMGARYIRRREDYARNGWAAYLRPAEGERFGGLLRCTTPPVGDGFTEVETGGAKALLRFTLPCVAVTDTDWVNWWSPPPGEATALPALISQPHGKGRVFYCAFDLFTMAEQGGYNYLDELFGELLDRAAAPLPLRLRAAAPRLLRTGFFRRGGELLIHQLSNLPYAFDGQLAPTPGGTLCVDTARYAVRSARVVWPEEQSLPVHTRDGLAEIELPSFSLGQIVSLSTR